MPDTINTVASEAMSYLGNPSCVILAHLMKSPIPEHLEYYQPSDFDEANFNGYTPAKCLNPRVIYQDGEDYAEIGFDPVTFVGDGSSDQQAIWGVYVTEQIGTGPVTLKAIDAFTSPAFISKSGDGLEYEVVILAAPNGY